MTTSPALASPTTHWCSCADLTAASDDLREQLSWWRSQPTWENSLTLFQHVTTRRRFALCASPGCPSAPHRDLLASVHGELVSHARSQDGRRALMTKVLLDQLSARPHPHQKDALLASTPFTALLERATSSPEQALLLLDGLPSPLDDLLVVATRWRSSRLALLPLDHALVLASELTHHVADLSRVMVLPAPDERVLEALAALLDDPTSDLELARALELASALD